MIIKYVKCSMKLSFIRLTDGKIVNVQTNAHAVT